ncbi:MAG TPA: hypothetical protein VK563_08140 [Puia sp.]|nr:hypothetical protein [Puia sp.]
MYFSLVSLSEFGQFLQILLWIFLPIFILSLLVTTYLHYRKRSREQQDQFMPAFSDEISPALRAAILSSASSDGLSGKRAGDGSTSRTADMSSSRAADMPLSRPEDRSDTQGMQEDTDSPYKGLLWMKNKYEQDRELADLKYEQLKSEFRHSEEKYTAILGEQRTLRDLLSEKDFRIGLLQNQLDDRQAWIDRLNEQSQQDKTRSEELAAKLELSSKLLLKIHQELDRSRAGWTNHPLEIVRGEDNAQDPFSQPVSHDLPDPSNQPSSSDQASLPDQAVPLSQTNLPAQPVSDGHQTPKEPHTPGETKIVSWMESGPA